VVVQTLWLVRHGESVGNLIASRAERDGVERIPLDERDADVPLSPTGEKQARALGAWLRPRRQEIDAYVVSPYARARETLALARGGDDPRAIVDERLRDRELGILDRLTSAGVRALHPEEAERRRHLGKFYHRPPGGESWADVALRLRSFLRDLFDLPAETVMVVAHDAIVTLVTALLTGMGERELLDFADRHPVRNASLTRLDRGSDAWELVTFSDVDHLRAQGADVTVHEGTPDVQQ
jgi:2,3-bisphosphoglycerate-dependent phosphoglycerate mutase